ncbi:MAG: M24 family metallopeptidase [Pseudomonadota bacterium]|nr:M24 family metallopeptidase [Pseudomonadota bacterium]
MADVAIGLHLLGKEERAIVAASYPGFAAGEITARRQRIMAAMEEVGLDALVMAEFGFGSGAVHWLTNWPATTAAVLVYVPGQPLHLVVEHYNHLPHARRMALDAEVVWGERKPVSVATNILKKLAPSVNRIGLMGRLTANDYRTLGQGVDEIRDFNQSYFALRLIKSEAEISWMRIGALFSDMALDAMVNAIHPGINERELAAATQAAYLPHGGAHVIEFMGVTQMEDPDCCVPWQFPSTRAVQRGDALVTEISSHFWTFSGQVLRTMTVEAEPNPLYQELHDVAEAVRDGIEEVLRPGCTAAEVINQTAVIEEAGFTIWDDVTHGYGGGYLQPVLGCASRPTGPVPDFTFAENMCLVVQPNIITMDATAGVQTGGLVRITADGCERMQIYPTGLIRI